MKDEILLELLHDIESIQIMRRENWKEDGPKDHDLEINHRTIIQWIADEIKYMKP